MEQANVKVSFYLKKSEADADGMCPVMARLNIGKYSEAAFSLKLRVPQAIWSSGRASGKSVKAKEINNRLDEIRAMALGIYAELSILADIRLTDGLSFEALKYAPATIPIIFTTAYDEYAVQAFKFNSFDYLLKPLDSDELEAAIDKAAKAGKNYTDENLQQLFDALQKNKFRYRERFLLPYRDGYKTVRVSDINHIETENKIVYLRLNNGTSEVVNVSMDELEHQLNPDYFFRANRQYIINVEHVLFLGNYFGGKLIVRLKGYPKTEIQVSKEKAQRLKEWIDR